MLKILDNDRYKIGRSSDYNFNFDKQTGYFERWGITKEDDPQLCEYGPEILDIEITTICNGVKQPNGKESPCLFCYKNNTSIGKNMSFKTFKCIIDKFPKTLTQIAFGADSHATSNPDLWKMMEYSRSIGVIPNITVADISEETADKLSQYCGAVAISRYTNKDLCYDSVKRLTDRGMDQINIHMLVSSETEDMVWETLQDRLIDPRLEKLNAIVLLSLKKKGRGHSYNILPVIKFNAIINFALNNNIKIGFDSCSCQKFLNGIQSRDNYELLNTFCEPCESSLMSFFVDVNGYGFPCSFTQGNTEWTDGINMVDCTNFIKDVWFHKKIHTFRQSLLNNNRNCIIYNI